VGSYARHYRYSPAEQAEVSDRLQVVTRLLKQHDCADSGQLLDAAARAEGSLETWFRAEGAQCTIIARDHTILVASRVPCAVSPP
jgi:hypothetical protein